MSTSLDSFKPIIYVPREGSERSLIEVLYEDCTDYFVLWYHWPKDDYTGKEDYEPVILLLEGQWLVDIGIRPHNRYKHSQSWYSEGGRPIIIFMDPWHAATIYKGGPLMKGGFIINPLFEKREEYVLTQGQPPPYYLKADAKKSVYEYAEERLNDLRKDYV